MLAIVLPRSRWKRLVGERTALTNQLRAVLLERGIVVPQAQAQVRTIPVIMMNQHGQMSLNCLNLLKQRSIRLRALHSVLL